jgi:hypothetical protein
MPVLRANEYKGICGFLERAPQLYFILIDGHGDGNFLFAASRPYVRVADFREQSFD